MEMDHEPTSHTHTCPSCTNDWTCWCTTEACIFDGKLCDGCQLELLVQADGFDDMARDL